MNESAPIDPSAPAPAAAVTAIRPRAAWRLVDPRELLRYRDLAWMLALRDIRVRYKQTALGVIWAVLQPLAMVGLLVYLMGRRLGVAEMADPLYVLAGVLPWTLFAAVLTAATNSVVANADIITKVYFPRVIVPLASAGAPVVDFLVGLSILACVAVFGSAAVSAAWLLIPAVALSALLGALGIGLLLAALAVTYRDFRHAVPFLVQVMFFLTPVIYPHSVLGDRGPLAALANPMVGPIAAMRSIVTGSPIDLGLWGLSLASAASAMVVGLAYFSRVERRFADVV